MPFQIKTLQWREYSGCMFIPFHHFSLLRSFLLFYHRFIRGYIPPECYENSTISMMNDVYAFGVTVINIISVMCRNIQPYERLLCTWAWDAWEAGQMEEVFDPKLYEGSQLREIKRCVEVGLLCLQSDRADRPTMADVLEMLHGKKRLPTLKKPAYMESESESEIESVTEGRSRNRWNRTWNRKSLRKAAHHRR